MKICPLLSFAHSVRGDGNVSDVRCLGERCAWWDTMEEECALVSLNRHLARIPAAVLAASGQLNTRED